MTYDEQSMQTRYRVQNCYDYCHLHTYLYYMLMISRTKASSTLNLVDTEIIQSYLRKKQSYLTNISIYFRKITFVYHEMHIMYCPNWHLTCPLKLSEDKVQNASHFLSSPSASELSLSW